MLSESNRFGGAFKLHARHHSREVGSGIKHARSDGIRRPGVKQSGKALIHIILLSCSPSGEDQPQGRNCIRELRSNISARPEVVCRSCKSSLRFSVVRAKERVKVAGDSLRGGVREERSHDVQSSGNIACITQVRHGAMQCHSIDTRRDMRRSLNGRRPDGRLSLCLGSGRCDSMGASANWDIAATRYANEFFREVLSSAVGAVDIRHVPASHTRIAESVPRTSQDTPFVASIGHLCSMLQHLLLHRLPCGPATGLDL